ncbi:MAG: hypothetical protein H6553_11520 [Chitinophagales bacterium]|nr:hypothetical protein [Chitinophagales bacterium]
MENEFLDYQKENPLQLNEQAKSYLMITCKWSKFLAIIGFVYIGIFCLIGAFAGSFFKQAMNGMSGISPLPFNPNILGIIYILLAALIFYPVVKLYKFSKIGLAALASNNSHLIEESLSNLKSFFKFQGVLVAIVIGFYFLIMVVSLLGGIAGSFM